MLDNESADLAQVLGLAGRVADLRAEDMPVWLGTVERLRAAL